MKITPNLRHSITHAITHTTGIVAAWGGLLADALIPKRCQLCATPNRHGICVDCHGLLPWIGVGCEVCGTPLPEAGVCGDCQRQPRHYERGLIPFRYESPIASHIHHLKYNQQLRYADFLGAMMCQQIWQDAGVLPEIIIPVPLHPRRLRQRGFNQALEIARRIGEELGLEVDYTSLLRVKDTVAQVGLSGAARRQNVRGAFRVRNQAAVRGTHVALVDDVVTSGSTVTAAAHALKRAGVTRVSVWAAAKTLRF